MLLILQNIYNGNQLKDCGLKMGSCTFEVNFILQSVIKILTAAITYPKYVIAVEPFWSIGYRAGLGKGESKCKCGPDLCFQGYLAGSLTCLGSCFLGQSWSWVAARLLGKDSGLNCTSIWVRGHPKNQPCFGMPVQDPVWPAVVVCSA